MLELQNLVQIPALPENVYDLGHSLLLYECQLSTLQIGFKEP